jgi:hypothetical protein
MKYTLLHKNKEHVKGYKTEQDDFLSYWKFKASCG